MGRLCGILNPDDLEVIQGALDPDKLRLVGDNLIDNGLRKVVVPVRQNPKTGGLVLLDGHHRSSVISTLAGRLKDFEFYAWIANHPKDLIPKFQDERDINREYQNGNLASSFLYSLAYNEEVAKERGVKTIAQLRARYSSLRSAEEFLRFYGKRH